jgi:8-oxo-dGTP pyrophosphatase MutT (NUDIX family)
MAYKSLTHAGCVVFRDDEEKLRYLVISSSTNEHWVLPKGHIDPGENPETTALRELAEETGVLGEIIQPLSIQKYWMPRENVIIQYYLVRRVGETTPMENRKLFWEEKISALNKLSFEEARNALNEIVEDTINKILK